MLTCRRESPLAPGIPKHMDDLPGPNRVAGSLFVGRDAELAELVAGLEDAINGRGRLFLVAGEPGIGKTMLAEQLAERARARGARVLWGRCWDGGGAPAYWPWTQILRPLVAEGDALAHPTDLAALFPEVAEQSRAGSDAARFYLFAAVMDLLKQAAARPLLIVLDDLHAADPASLLLLRFVAGDLRRSALLVVATYRDVEAHRRADVAEALGELVREGPSLRLRGLDRGAVGRFVESLTGTRPTENALTRIHEASGGNPLFIREMVHLSRAGAEAGEYRHPAISEGLRALIHRHLASLDGNAVHVLSVAAVVGQVFDVALVEQVPALELPEILQSLAQAERLGLLSRVPGSTSDYRFSHGLVREVLYDELPIAVRRELHARVGAAIERLYAADLTPHLSSLAYHFAQVGGGEEAARAGEYARRAGDQAMDAYGYEEAAFQYRRALEVLRLGRDEGTRCDLLLRLGHALARSGDYRGAKETFRQAAEIARRLNAPEQLAQAALGFGEPQVEGGVVSQELLALLQEALDGLSPDDSALRARLLARFSLELTFSEDERLRESVREALSREALEMARRLGDVATLAIAARARWLAVWGPDGLEERAALSEEILRLARQTGDREMELVGRARRITCSLESGDIPAVDTDIAAHARLAGELRMPYHAWTAATQRAGRALLEGSFERAEQLAGEAPSLLPGRLNAHLAYLNQITPIRWEQGRLGELYEAWQEIVEHFPQAGFSRGWLALASAEMGREEEARRHLHSLVEMLPRLPSGGLWLPSVAVAALAAGRLDDGGAAAAIYPSLLPYAQRVIVIPMPHAVMSFGAATLYLGLLASAMSRWDEARAHFEAAIGANSRLGARAFLARTEYEYARALLRQGRAEDQCRAGALLERAAATAGSLGMTALGRAIERLREGEARADDPAPRPESANRATPVEDNIFRREGDYWTIVYQGAVARIRDTKGLRILARLLAEPGREFHAVELEAAAAAGTVASPAALGGDSGPDELEVRPDLGDAGALLDARAKAAYKARLEELRADLAEAESFNDPVRAANIKAEIDFLVDELARAVGLGGRDRKAASHAERARLNVTRAVKTALANIDKHHSALGRHLQSTVKTGAYCSYTPDPRIPIEWKF